MCEICIDTTEGKDHSQIMAQVTPSANPELSICLSQLMEAEDLLLKVRRSLTLAVGGSAYVQPSQVSAFSVYSPAPPQVKFDVDPSLVVKTESFKPPVDIPQTPPEPAPVEMQEEQEEKATSNNGPAEGKMKIANGVQYTSKDLASGEAFGSEAATVEALQEAETLAITEEDLLKCRSIFVNGDADHSGLVNTLELRTMLEEATGTTLEEDDYTGIIRKFDANRDGTLNFIEFLRAYCFTPGKESKSLKSQIDHFNNQDARNEAERALSIEDRVKKFGTRVDVIVWYLRSELAENNACMQIPIVFLLLVLWFIALILHTKFYEIQAVEEAITYDIESNANFAFGGAIPFDNGRMGHKNINDVNYFNDFWSWFDLGLVPLFWPEGWDVSETRSTVASQCTPVSDAFFQAGWPQLSLASVLKTPVSPELCPNISDVAPLQQGSALHPTYLYFHTIIGGVRLRQERVASLDCSFERPTKVAAECYEITDNWLKPELHNFFATNFDLLNQPGGETHYLLSSTNRSIIRRQLRELEDQGWMSTRTAVVELLLTTYNPHVDIFVGTFIRIYFNRAGHMHKVIEPVCHWLYPYHGWWCYAADFSWILVVLRLFGDDVLLLFKYWREVGVLRGTWVYMSFGNLVCLMTTLYSFGLIYNWVDYLFQIHELRDYVERADLNHQGSFHSENELEGFYDLVESMSSRLFTSRSWLAGYPFVIGLRLFRTFDSQPRLALVTRTLQRASMEIIHFGVVFFSAFLIYTAAAMVLFGSETVEYSSLSRACTSVFVVLLGGFDWDSMTGVGLPHSMVWFWTFIIFVQLIMLNMLLAIVMDVYTQVKSGLEQNAPTIFSQVITIYRRWHEKKMGRRVGLDQVMKILNPKELDMKHFRHSHQEEYISPEQLMEKVPGLGLEQATRICVLAMEDWAAEGKEDPPAMSDNAVMVQQLTQDVSTLHETVRHQFGLQRLSACLTASTTRDILKLLQERLDP